MHSVKLQTGGREPASTFGEKLTDLEEITITTLKSKMN